MKIIFFIFIVSSPFLAFNQIESKQMSVVRKENNFRNELNEDDRELYIADLQRTISLIDKHLNKLYDSNSSESMDKIELFIERKKWLQLEIDLNNN